MVATWLPGVTYSNGDVVLNQGRFYYSLQVHMSQGDWQPHLAPSHWAPVPDHDVHLYQLPRPSGYNQTLQQVFYVPPQHNPMQPAQLQGRTANFFDKLQEKVISGGNVSNTSAAFGSRAFLSRDRASNEASWLASAQSQAEGYQQLIHTGQQPPVEWVSYVLR
jgi:hypothetical protein